jgi:hypothetical protein
VPARDCGRHVESPAHGALDVALRGDGEAEVDDRAVAEPHRDAASTRFHGRPDGLVVGGEEVPEVFGIEPLPKLGRAHEIREQDGEMAAFGVLQGRAALEREPGATRLAESRGGPSLMTTGGTAHWVESVVVGAPAGQTERMTGDGGTPELLRHHHAPADFV